MPTREEKIAFLKSQGAGEAPTASTRAEKIAFLQNQLANQNPQQAPREDSWLDSSIAGTTPRKVIKGGLNSLPMAGTIIGGALGTPADVVAGPLGNIAGAGAGAYVGKVLQNAGERMLGEDKSRKDIYISPITEGIKGAGQEMSGQVFSKGMGLAAKAAADTKAGQFVMEKIGKGASKLASTFTGVPQKEIETYAQNASEINDLAKSADFDHQEMADQLRQKLNKTIQTKRQALNGQISKALGSTEGAVDASPILDALETSKGKINAALRPEEVGQVDGLIGKVKELASSDGQISLADAHDLKEYFQDAAKGTYQQGGQIFQVGKKAGQAAKSAAAAARGLVNKAAPEIAQANNSLSRLHDIEDVMNKNMLAEGKTAASLYAAGSGGNPANAKILKQLGEETGTNMLGEAEKLSAARTFGKPSLLPIDNTGKSLTRMGVAGGLGYVVGGPAGAIAAEGLASPAAVKVAINAGRVAGPAAKAVAQNAQAMGVASRPAMDAIRNKIGSSYSSPDEAPKSPAEPTIQLSKDTAPLKGSDKWASDGFEKLLAHAKGTGSIIPQNKEVLLANPKIKRLMIGASDLTPGSKAMENILKEIKKIEAEKK